MGFLTEGSTFVWEEASQSPVELVRKHGIIQFLEIYKKEKDTVKEKHKWGDEIEYIVVAFDDENQKVYLSLRGHEILDKLMEEEHRILELKKAKKQQEQTNGIDHKSTFILKTLWRPEYAKYMVEGTPGKPYGSNGLDDISKIEESMKERRLVVQQFLKPNERIVTITNFPLLGAIQSGPYTLPHFVPGGPVARSLFTPDEIIHPHFRFSTLTKNIRNRRGSKVSINMPLYRDTNTTTEPLPLPVPACPDVPQPPPSANQPNNIYMDSMAFGMGCCCVQCTFQSYDITEARRLYDHLAVMSPIMLSFTAATPILRGYLANTDVRWNLIVNGVDDRTEEERGVQPLKNNRYVINKSRYDSIDCYISTDKQYKSEYNDLNLVYNKEAYDRLREGGIDDLMARHIAHLFIRDPLVIYRDKLLIDDTLYSDHFENIQSTNWQTVRFKPPPPGTSVGWRVEFRPMEVQLTDFENAAFVTFMVLLTRMIIKMNLNFYIPITKVDENMKTAHKRDSINNSKFYFRKSLTSESQNNGPVDEEYELMTINEIFNGKAGSSSVGLIPLVRTFLDTVDLAVETRNLISEYLSFISLRASGELMTTATWIRNFVTSHEDYKHDSVVSPKINYDLMKTCDQIGRGELHPTQLLGKFGKR